MKVLLTSAGLGAFLFGNGGWSHFSWRSRSGSSSKGDDPARPGTTGL